MSILDPTIDTSFRFIVYTQPLPKQRPRFGKGNVYTPSKTEVYETLIGYACSEEMMGASIEPFTGDISISLTFGRTGKRRADLDNLIKATADGLNGIAFTDDKQIVSITARVKYGCKEPYVAVSIAEFREMES